MIKILETVRSRGLWVVCDRVLHTAVKDRWKQREFS